MKEQLRFLGLDNGPNFNVRELTRTNMTREECILDDVARTIAMRYGTPLISRPKSMVEPNDVTALLSLEDGSVHDTHLDLDTGKNRIGYSGVAAQIANDIAEATSYNAASTEKEGNVNLAHPENQGLRDSTYFYYEDHPTSVVIPMAREPMTGKIALEYAGDMVAPKHVIGITMGIDEQTEVEVAEVSERTGSTLLRQHEVLKSVDWAKLCKMFRIPYDSARPSLPPKGTKGLTMLSGLIAARTINGHSANGLAFIDSDILNNAAGGYDPLAYLALPGVVDPDEQLRAITLARTGPGRNNEVMIESLNNIAYDEQIDDESRHVALWMAATNSWALTGERLFPAVDGTNLAFQIPWTTGMSIETQMNLYRASLEIQTNRLHSAQVFNPNPKVERGASDAVREFSMLSRCVDWQERVLDFSTALGRQLPDFDCDDIARFNDQYGGQEQTRFYISSNHAPNTPRVIGRDFMLPSVETMKNLGLINMDQLNTYAEH